MADRRALIAGLNPDEEIDPDAAEQFITGHKPRQAAKVTAPAPQTEQREPDPPPPAPTLPRSLATANAPVSSPLTGIGRVPVGARVRTDLAVALKRASLERQLHGIEPNSVQDIIEDALELWLHKHGLLR